MANCNSAKVLKKSVKSETKCNETGQNDCLGVGYLMDKEVFEFWPNLCLWQDILADFAKSAKTLYLGLGMADFRNLKG